MYEAKDYSHLIGMDGFSENLLKNHFTLYQGYVSNTNKLRDEMAQLAKDGKHSTPEFAELKRRFGFEWNGMRLHELYFENLGGKGDLAQSEKLTNAVKADFGGFDAWLADFKAVGAMRGVGWAILYRDNHSGACINEWINEHQNNHLAGCAPVLVLDVFEHAFITDYGLKRADYIEAFLRNVKREVVENRLST
jgi:Fe-Mn family superoxide dismutase